jgi:hypothetical protein
MKDEITKIILKIAEEQNLTLPSPVDISKGAEAGLYGPGGVLDSLALVRFIVEIEAAVEDRFGTSVILASERAMSQRRSPFLTVGALAEYTEEIIKEAGQPQT